MLSVHVMIRVMQVKKPAMAGKRDRYLRRLRRARWRAGEEELEVGVEEEEEADPSSAIAV